MDLDERQTALVLARARAVLGLTMIVLPGAIGYVTFGKVGRSPAAKAALRMVGVRDLVMGLGAITTLKEQTMDAEWVGMAAIADAVDGAALLLTPGLGARARLAALSGFGGAAVGLMTARALADARTPDSSEIDS
jgi:hypothetical protein